MTILFGMENPITFPKKVCENSKHHLHMKWTKLHFVLNVMPIGNFTRNTFRLKSGACKLVPRHLLTQVVFIHPFVWSGWMCVLKVLGCVHINGGIRICDCSLNINQSNYHWLNQWFASSLIHEWKNIFHC